MACNAIFKVLIGALLSNLEYSNVNLIGEYIQVEGK